MPKQVIPADFMQRFAGVPIPMYEREIKTLVSHYERAFVKLVRQIEKMGPGLPRQQAESLLRQFDFILRELDRDVKVWCETTLPDVFADAQRYSILALGEAASLAEAASLSSFSMLARRTTEALISDTYRDMLVATTNMEVSVKRLVRSKVGEILREQALQQQGVNSTRKVLVERLTESMQKDGWVGIVDKAGRRWNLNTYSEMVARTKIQQSWHEATSVEMQERDIDLCTISRHGAKDACSHFEGMVISRFGNTPGYSTYDELRASQLIFHPNCGHKIFPLREFDLLNDQQKAHHNTQAQESRRALAAGRR